MEYRMERDGPFWHFYIEAGTIGEKTAEGQLKVCYEVTPDGLFTVCPLCRRIHKITARVYHGGHIGCLACPNCRNHSIYKLEKWIAYMREKNIPGWRFE